jgi:hypothetical protein
MKGIDFLAIFAVIVLLMAAGGICLIGSRALRDASLPAEVVRR